MNNPPQFVYVVEGTLPWRGPVFCLRETNGDDQVFLALADD